MMDNATKAQRIAGRIGRRVEIVHTGGGVYVAMSSSLSGRMVAVLSYDGPFVLVYTREAWQDGGDPVDSETGYRNVAHAVDAMTWNQTHSNLGW